MPKRFNSCPQVRLIALLPAIILAGLPVTAWSQALEELVVTARKKEESLQQVPISITAFSAEQLQSIGANNNEDVAYLTVNFNSVAQLGRRLDRPVIRGMAAPSTFGEPNASYFIDGAYVSGSISTLTLGPIERVEILRGPQSAQFGRATFSGAVNYVTRQPTNEFTGEVLTKAASHDSYTASGWASGPIIADKLLFFTSASFDEYGGEWKNNLDAGQADQADKFVNPPQQADYTDNIGGTRTTQLEGKLLWNVTDTANLTFKLGYNHGDDEHYPQLIVETSELNCYVPIDGVTDDEPWHESSPGNYCGVLKPNGREMRVNLPDIRSGMVAKLAPDPTAPPDSSVWISEGEEVGARRDQYNSLLRYDQQLGDWNMTANAAYNDSQFDTAYDLDHTENRPMLGLFHFYSEIDRDDYSLDIRFTSPEESRVRGSIGTYYFDFEEERRQHGNVGLAQGTLSDPTRSTTENIALFGSLEFDITDKLILATEARVARDTKEIHAPIACTNEDSPWYNGGQPISKKESSDSFTPRFTLSYFATDAAMVYGQIAKGNKPGNFNNPYFNDGVEGCNTEREYDEYGYVQEEDSWNYEIGTKTSWMDNRLVANLALFYIDWDNQTIFETRDVIFDLLFAPSAIGINAGKSEVYGLELETSFALTEHLKGTFSYGLAKGEFKQFESGALENLTGDSDGSGKEIPNSPKHNFVTSLAYQRQITSQLGWFARTDFSWSSRYYTSATNTEQIGERRRWNARLGLDTDVWKLSLFVNNILDEQTPSAILGFPDLTDFNDSGNYPEGYALTPTPGRAGGAELVFRFGH